MIQLPAAARSRGHTAGPGPAPSPGPRAAPAPAPRRRCCAPGALVPQPGGKPEETGGWEQQPWGGEQSGAWRYLAGGARAGRALARQTAGSPWDESSGFRGEAGLTGAAQDLAHRPFSIKNKQAPGQARQHHGLKMPCDEQAPSSSGGGRAGGTRGGSRPPVDAVPGGAPRGTRTDGRGRDPARRGAGRRSGWSPASRRGRRAASGAGPREAAPSSETIAAAGAAALMGLGDDVKLPY